MSTNISPYDAVSRPCVRIPANVAGGNNGNAGEWTRRVRVKDALEVAGHSASWNKR